MKDRFGKRLIYTLIRAFSAAVGRKATKQYHINGIGRASKTAMYVCDSAQKFQIMMDVPTAMGGGNSAPQPVELLLASLCGCEQVTAEFIAKHSKPRVRIDKIQFNLFATRNPRASIALPLHTDLPPSRLERIWGTAYVHTDASQEQIDIIEKEIKRRCPVANMILLSGCELDIKFIKAEQDKCEEDVTTE